MTAQSKLSSPRLLEPTDLSLPLDDGDLLIQVTDPNVFAQAHIEGAVLLSPAQLCWAFRPRWVNCLTSTRYKARLQASVTT